MEWPEAFAAVGIVWAVAAFIFRVIGNALNMDVKEKTMSELRERDIKDFVLVVGGNYEQAKDHARKQGYRLWRYVRWPYQLRGLRNAKISYTGTYFERQDFAEIYAFHMCGDLQEID